MSNRWDPAQYGRFANHRSRPALELLGRIDHPNPTCVVDLGCGTGDVTRVLKERWTHAKVIGIDHSLDMLGTAAEGGGDVVWQHTEIGEWVPDHPIDVLYSNAALHWLADHYGLFPRLISYLSPGGVLAVQMPLSWSEPSHALMRAILESGGPDGRPLGPQSLRTRMKHNWVKEPDEYYDLLSPLAGVLDVWTTRYFQVLRGPEPVFEWVKGTGLRPVVESLTEHDLDRFLTLYREASLEAYPQRVDGATVYPFPRLFIVAQTAA